LGVFKLFLHSPAAGDIASFFSNFKETPSVENYNFQEIAPRNSQFLRNFLTCSSLFRAHAHPRDKTLLVYKNRRGVTKVRKICTCDKKFMAIGMVL